VYALGVVAVVAVLGGILVEVLVVELNLVVLLAVAVQE
jgi:hypothetical protein